MGWKWFLFKPDDGKLCPLPRCGNLPVAATQAQRARSHVRTACAPVPERGLTQQQADRSWDIGFDCCRLHFDNATSFLASTWLRLQEAKSFCANEWWPSRPKIGGHLGTLNQITTRSQLPQVMGNKTFNDCIPRPRPADRQAKEQLTGSQVVRLYVSISKRQTWKNNDKH